MANSRFTLHYKRSCHDCIFLQICTDPNASYNGDYVCKDWEWKYK